MGVVALVWCLATLAVACDDATSPPTPTVAPQPEVTVIARPPIGPRANLPPRDAAALAARYGMVDGAVPSARPFQGEHAVGSRREFVVSRISGAALNGAAPPTVLTIAATVQVITEHAYFYVEDAIAADPEEVQQAADRFEAEVWPLVTGIFGEPEAPGIDGDPRVIILQADLGGAVGGYFSPEDTLVRELRPLSNEAEMVYLNQTLRPGGDIYSAVLAHELQHLIHHRNDAGEEAWVNEGLSEATLLLAGGFPSTIRSFQSRPETQLTVFDTEDSQPHYGAGAAFLRFVADRLGGGGALGGIARAAGDGEAGIEAYVQSQDPSLSFRSLFGDWIAANVLRADSGPYAEYSVDVEAAVGEELAPGEVLSGTAHQFGANYTALTDVYDGRSYVVRFQGQTTVRSLPLSALDGGDGAIWSNAEDDINTTATFPVDLTGAQSPTLTFRTWFDIEPWYDWGYVSVSNDEGSSWRTIEGEHTLILDVLEVGIGDGYGGTSGGREEPGWFDERFDLSAYTGQRILLRFEYVTDGGVHRDGWVVDDVGIDGGAVVGKPALEGWIPVPESLPQEWIVRLLLTYEDGAVEVMDVPMYAGSGEIRFSTAGIGDAVIVVAGATEGTRQPAQYELRLDRVDEP